MTYETSRTLAQAADNVLDCAYLWVAEDADKGAQAKARWETVRDVAKSAAVLLAETDDVLIELESFADSAKNDVDREIARTARRAEETISALSLGRITEADLPIGPAETEFASEIDRIVEAAQHWISDDADNLKAPDATWTPLRVFARRIPDLLTDIDAAVVEAGKYAEDDDDQEAFEKVEAASNALDAFKKALSFEASETGLRTDRVKAIEPESGNDAPAPGPA